MKPLHIAVRRAIWFGGIAAIMTFVRIDFSEGFEDWRLRQQGIYWIRCWPDATATVRAGVWSFVAYAAVFTPALLLSVGRTRRDVFQGGDDHAS